MVEGGSRLVTRSLFFSLGLLSIGCSQDYPTSSSHGRFIQSALADEVETAEQKRFVVVVEDGFDVEDVANELARETGGSIRTVYKYALQGFAIDMPYVRVAELDSDQRIKFYGSDLPVITAEQSVPPGMDRIAASPSQTNRVYDFQNPVDVDIAIIDTGVDIDHPDLNVVQSVSFVDNNSTGDGDRGHGSHVAGIAAARNNDQAVIGVAPGARIWNVKVLDQSGRGFLCDVIAGIDYATEHRDEIEVMNLSLTIVDERDVGDSCGEDTSDPFHVAICGAVKAGIVVVAAAGNEARDAARTLPAAYNEVIAVSAFIDTDGMSGGFGGPSSRGEDDTFAPFSNFGSVVDPQFQVVSATNFPNKTS